MQRLPVEVLEQVLFLLPVGPDLKQLSLACTAAARVIHSDVRTSWRHFQLFMKSEQTACPIHQRSHNWWASLPLCYQIAAVAHCIATNTELAPLSPNSAVRLVHALHTHNSLYRVNLQNPVLLNWAVYHGYTEAAEMLMSFQPASLTAAKSWAVYQAVTRGPLAMVQMLLAHPNVKFFETQYVEAALTRLTGNSSCAFERSEEVVAALAARKALLVNGCNKMRP
ncbi:hypothetical protein HDU77_001099 [Chytriomyces hyalinus]|nr:hypothetical protein HDU77_001099 [Chytriomyces hyalinus]